MPRFVDYRRQRGRTHGRAPVVNYKKLSVVRAEWRRRRVDDTMMTDMGRAALFHFKNHHPTYARYYAMHNKVLSDHRLDESLPWYEPNPAIAS